ncbi:Nucleic acid-binding, OB-fold [Sesbania bispinosa]|nr:Nucleic acid-binding, OB-fold [Sesbania bispinosa]
MKEPSKKQGHCSKSCMPFHYEWAGIVGNPFYARDSMSAMGEKFIHIRQISPDAPLWVVTAQLIRLWTNPICSDFSCVQTVEMIFMDPEDRPTRHPFRLAIHKHSQVIKVDSVCLTSFGLSPMKCSDIVRRKQDSDVLVDTVGLLTSLSCQREYISEGKDVAAIYMEITDPSNGPCTPVIVVQFARIVPDAQVLYGDVGIESVDNITRVLFNPQIPEVFQMLEWLHNADISLDGKIQYQHLDMPCLSLRDEFFLYHPRRRTGDLNQTEQVGVFVICATIIGLLENQAWWFSSCKTRPCSSKGPSLYSCDGSYSLIPRYNLRVEISDGQDTTYLSLGYADMQRLMKISCEELISKLQVPHSNTPPHVFNSLIGKRMLFLVKTFQTSSLQEVDFKVKRVCDDKELVRMFYKGHFFRSDRKPKATIARMLGEPRNTHQFHHGHGSSHVGPMGYGGPSSSHGSLSINNEGTQLDSNTYEQVVVDKHCVNFQPADPRNDS